MCRSGVRLVLFGSIFSALFAFSVPWYRAEFPNKPITLVIPSRAGGGHDLTFRAVVSVASQYLGQPIIIRLEPGGWGIGSDQVSKARPDGYTLLAGARVEQRSARIEGRSKGPDDLMALCRINYNSLMLVARGNGHGRTSRS